MTLNSHAAKQSPAITGIFQTQARQTKSGESVIGHYLHLLAAPQPEIQFFYHETSSEPESSEAGRLT
jgi:hypothetical protein